MHLINSDRFPPPAAYLFRINFSSIFFSFFFFCWLCRRVCVDHSRTPIWQSADSFDFHAFLWRYSAERRIHHNDSNQIFTENIKKHNFQHKYWHYKVIKCIRKWCCQTLLLVCLNVFVQFSLLLMELKFSNSSWSEMAGHRIPVVCCCVHCRFPFCFCFLVSCFLP